MQLAQECEVEGVTLCVSPVRSNPGRSSAQRAKEGERKIAGFP